MIDTNSNVNEEMTKMNTVILVLSLLLLLDILIAKDNSVSSSISSSSNRKELRIAFCVTGQLARLELVSKIYNVFIENAKLGHRYYQYYSYCYYYYY